MEILFPGSRTTWFASKMFPGLNFTNSSATSPHAQPPRLLRTSPLTLRSLHSHKRPPPLPLRLPHLSDFPVPAHTPLAPPLRSGRAAHTNRHNCTGRRRESNAAAMAVRRCHPPPPLPPQPVSVIAMATRRHCHNPVTPPPAVRRHCRRPQSSFAASAAAGILSHWLAT